ncbi:TPA: hypothetical protein DIU27_03880 [Candidatus Collierbacteria bacterium]|uniref:Uncharacterized protein n=1 Tax=Candidatus Collierbacteria bacterium GW2011_GWB2_44_22 TaxID=1618387 RepID=A0A0G1HVD0_9BACT|nr:MAG: hypothetical protein UW31_C0019G0015 [Candidatus Collierbacteria bacterium GW2011_GWA2_44_13]KKT50925.1 MAG: hypothetical protein UW44_C0022G0001 [Candidatus Collierbacteria bacterium GW2011_GWB2_44_22]KKT61319.1 MAG: hypothetical protein UW56_C0028G0009 [Candidatus Collierbacteria bacterium GW2011_GWD1_44_27]KKT67927.1 MAG: hypothetical protein UW64_C0034G0001 [Microgenomates group bacterium GW2011_GWC1_44_37]KKT87682.1 MAG: hypothetical protein UW88_C0024G0011 [Candidatus Collierbacte
MHDTFGNRLWVNLVMLVVFLALILLCLTQGQGPLATQLFILGIVVELGVNVFVLWDRQMYANWGNAFAWTVVDAVIMFVVLKLLGY